MLQYVRGRAATLLKGAAGAMFIGGVLALATFRPAGASAAEASPRCSLQLFVWQTRDGGLAFTDDAKRIPTGYRDEAQAYCTGPLADYGRLTVEGPERRRVVENRLKQLRSRVGELPR